MSYGMTEEQELIQNNTREFVEEYVSPLADSLDKSNEYPAATVARLAEQGLLGLVIPAEFGGLEAGYRSFAGSAEEVSQRSATIAAILSQHTVAAGCIARFGGAAQKANLLSAMAEGKLLGGIALYEDGPRMGAGADALVATPCEGGFLLRGTKTEVGNAGQAGVYVAFAASDSGNGKSLTAFLVSADCKGVSIAPAVKRVGLHGYPVATIKFEDVHVKTEAVLGEVHGGAAVLKWTTAVSSVAEGAQTVGITAAAVKHAAAYSKQRVQFGRPIGTFQAVQTMLAGVAANCHAVRLAVLDTALLIDQAKPFEAESAMVKLLALNLGQKSLCDVVQVEGGYGYSEEMLLARLYRDVACVTLRNSPTEFPEKIIAESIA